MGAAASADDGVNLVDDDGPCCAQHLAAALRGEEQVEGLWRGHQNMRRSLEHRRTLGLGGVAGPDRRSDARRLQPHLFRDLPNALAGFREILVNVRAQSLER